MCRGNTNKFLGWLGVTLAAEAVDTDRATSLYPPFARGGSAGLRPPFALGEARRAGTVLVMVVAMLSMLFIVGLTFLSTVQFETDSLKGQSEAKQQSEIIDRLSREVRTVLRQGFLGDDGKAWNRDSESGGGVVSPIGADLYGELPGVHPLIASIEPHEAYASAPPMNGQWAFLTTSDLEMALASPPVPVFEGLDPDLIPGSGNEISIANMVLVDAPIGLIGLTHPNPDPLYDNFNFNSPRWRERFEGDTQLSVDPTSPVLADRDYRIYRRDADGDGVWDSYERLLSRDRFPDAVRGNVVERLRADVPPDGGPEYDETFLGDREALYYALRVIPHGAMINVAAAHRTLLAQLPEFLVDDMGTTTFGCMSASYIPEGEEPVLRRRFLLPPKQIPLSQLQSRVMPDCTPGMEAGGQIPESLYRAFVSEPDWPNFLPANSDIVARWWPIDTGDDGGDASEIVPPAGVTNEPFWLNWVDPNSAKYDYRHVMTTVSHDDNLMRIGRDPGLMMDWATDWIDDIKTDNPDAFSIDDWPNSSDSTDPLNGRLKISLPGLVDQTIAEWNFANDPAPPLTNLDDLMALPVADPFRTRFVQTIQDGFLLMLRNVDSMAASVQANTAAALTANLIDFIDSDDVPTEIVPRHPVSGMELPIFPSAYGIEAQPFISELFLHGDGSSAVELYNPFSTSVSMANFSLDAGSDLDFSAVNWNSLSVPAGGFLVVHNSGPSIIGISNYDGSATGMLTSGSTVVLNRDVIGTSIIVDRFDAGGFSGSASGKSLQRVMKNGVDGTDSPWKVVVPMSEELNGHTLGAINANTTFDDNILPVEIVLVNEASSSVAAALPTTGSLLLLSRYANTIAAPFNSTLAATPEQIDNGRMPVFDQTQLASDIDPLLPLDLGIPWGQLVFDYFTALPLDNEYDPTIALSDPPFTITEHMPTVDQGGLRVHGRIDINAAPWSVLAGLPLVPSEAFAAYPASVVDRIVMTASLDMTSTNPTELNVELAQSIVAYREARKVLFSGDETADFSGATRLRPGTGFLTVGELANVRGGSAPSEFYSFDSGIIDDTDADYINAISVLVALGDWVTTKSHVFTVYGTLRGAGPKSAVDGQAVRFQETVDRLPSFFNNRLPRRVGPRVMGPYGQADRN